MASAKSDGLEWSMERTAGTAELEGTSEVHATAQTAQQATALLADYQLPSGGGTGAAGLVGAAITCALVAASGAIVSAVRQRRHHDTARQ